mgnify:CR=1 FL=1
MKNLSSIDAGGLKNLPSLQELYITHNKKLIKIDESALSFRNGSEESEQWPPIKKVSHFFHVDTAFTFQMKVGDLLGFPSTVPYRGHVV